MSQVPYNSYHGRKRHGRSVLIGVVTALVVVLAAVLVGYYCGFFNVPGPSARPTPPAQDVPGAQPTQEPVVVVESSAPSPSPSPSPAAVDLSGYVPPEKAALGLVLAQYDALADKAPERDTLVDMTAADLKTAALPETEHYLAAWRKIDPAQSEAALEDCKALAALGFDEIVLASTVPTDDGADLAGLYRDLKSGLAAAGWKGRLGLDLDQGLFADKYDADLIPAIAQSFDRLYFRTTLSGGNKSALTNNGFAADGLTIVTVTKGPANLNYAWAVLP